MSAHWHISSRQWAISEKNIVNIWHIAKHCVSLHSHTRKDDHSLHGEMAEWSNAPVLKTGVLQGTGGSNPSLSAKISVTSCKTTSYADFSFKGAPNLRQNFSSNWTNAFNPPIWSFWSYVESLAEDDDVQNFRGGLFDKAELNDKMPLNLPNKFKDEYERFLGT